MALTAADFIYPDGELLNAMFPDNDLETNIGVWLEQAGDLTTDESAQVHWVYYRAYTVVANRVAAMPSQQTTSQGGHSVTWSSDRVSAMQKKADYHKGEYERITEASTLGQPLSYFGRVRVVRAAV